MSEETLQNCCPRISFLPKYTETTLHESSNYFVDFQTCFKCIYVVHLCTLNNPCSVFFMCAPVQTIYLVQSQIIYFPSFILIE